MNNANDFGTLKRCETILLAIGDGYKSKTKTISTELNTVIENTYRMWTDSINTIYGISLWDPKNEAQIVSDPSCVSKVIEQIKGKVERHLEVENEIA